MRALLKDYARVWVCDESPDADTTVIRRAGDRDSVGQVLTASAFSGNICIKPLDNERLLPKYLFYAMQWVHSQGYWRALCGSRARCSIGVSDVEGIGIQPTT